MKLFKLYSKKELKEIILFQRQYINKLEQDLFENCNNYVISKKAVEEKILDLKQDLKENNYGKYTKHCLEYTLTVLEELKENKWKK